MEYFGIIVSLLALFYISLKKNQGLAEENATMPPDIKENKPKKKVLTPKKSPPLLKAKATEYEEIKSHTEIKLHEGEMTHQSPRIVSKMSDLSKKSDLLIYSIILNPPKGLE